ncbi:amidohydrolase family protein [Achromobacter aloeverae]
MNETEHNSFENTSSMTFRMPPKACDCHTHIHAEGVPFSDRRNYTPACASPETLADLHAALGIQRVVVVQPSVYGNDHTATLMGLRSRGVDARGIAVADRSTSREQLDLLDGAGVTGLRVNLAAARLKDRSSIVAVVREAQEIAESQGWHIELNANLAIISEIQDIIGGLPVTVVADHFGRAQATQGTGQTGFSELVRLVGAGRLYVKLSVPGGAREDYSGFEPLARALISANDERCVWGSNWPHPDVTQGRLQPMEVCALHQVDDRRVLSELHNWAREPAVRKKILVENPARLYRF